MSIKDTFKKIFIVCCLIFSISGVIIFHLLEKEHDEFLTNHYPNGTAEKIDQVNKLYNDEIVTYFSDATVIKTSPTIKPTIPSIFVETTYSPTKSWSEITTHFKKKFITDGWKIIKETDTYIDFSKKEGFPRGDDYFLKLEYKENQVSLMFSWDGYSYNLQ